MTDGPKNIRVGVYGILRDAGRVLITRTRTLAGPVMNFPGGAIDLGEGAIDALHREFIEETGLRITVGDLAYVTQRYHRSPVYPDNQLLKIYWFVERAGGTLRLEGNGDDVEACVWVPQPELSSIVGLTPGDGEMLQALRGRGLL